MLFVFDLDGTLLRDDKTLSDFTIQTLQTLKSHGHELMIATGRSYEMALPYVKMLELEGTLILNNGALIKSVDGKTIFRQKFVPKADQLKMIQHNNAKQLPYAIVAEDGVHGPKHHPLFYYRAFKERHPESTLQLFEYQDEQTLSQIDGYKLFTIIKDDTQFSEIQNTMQQHSEAYFTQSMRSYLDMLPKDTNKGEALTWLVNLRGYSLDNVVAFGDNDNDAQLLNVCGFSYAINNATIVAKNAAKNITSLSNNEDGVASLIQSWLNTREEGDLPWLKK